MQVHILASGSTGNTVFLQLGKTKILVDAGISTRRIEQGLAEVGVKAAELDAVLITHEHTDHVKGLDVLIRRYQLPVYARSDTWEMIKCRDKLPALCCREMPDNFSLGDLQVEAFSTSHDAVDPVGFCFYHDGIKCVLATDLGVVTAEVQKALSLADVVILESNHDPKMLFNGSYPGYLKQRIRSKKGHLSNYEAGHTLAMIKHKPLTHVFLAHLSQNNNNPDLAEETVKRILCNKGCEVGRELILHRTYPDRCSSFITR